MLAVQDRRSPLALRTAIVALVLAAPIVLSGCEAIVGLIEDAVTALVVLVGAGIMAAIGLTGAIGAATSLSSRPTPGSTVLATMVGGVGLGASFVAVLTIASAQTRSPFVLSIPWLSLPATIWMFMALGRYLDSRIAGSHSRAFLGAGALAILAVAGALAASTYWLHVTPPPPLPTPEYGQLPAASIPSELAQLSPEDPGKPIEGPLVEAVMGRTLSFGRMKDGRIYAWAQRLARALPGVYRSFAVHERTLCAVSLEELVTCFVWSFDVEAAPASSVLPTRGKVMDVAVGADRVCAATDSGVVCAPVEGRALGKPYEIAGVGSVVAVSLALDAGYAVSSSGGVVKFGERVEPIAVRTVKDIATRLGDVCYLHGDGRVLCSWAGKTAVVKEAADVEELAGSSNQVCARSKRGDVVCFERGAPGRKVPLAGEATTISASDSNVCAGLADGRFYCWTRAAPTVLGVVTVPAERTAP